MTSFCCDDEENSNQLLEKALKEDRELAQHIKLARKNRRINEERGRLYTSSNLALTRPFTISQAQLPHG